MLTIEIELLHGTIRAGSADDLALAGAEDPGDWPPSPARLFSAMVAADGTRERCRVTDGSELVLLESAPPPRIHADGRAAVIESPLRERFVVRNERTEGSVQEYAGRRSGLIRPGVRLAPRCPSVAYVWDHLEVDDASLASLRARAARVGYLGCSDSPVRVRVGTDPPRSDLPPWEPDPAGDYAIPVPFAGLVGVLDTMYDQWSDGVNVRRSWFRADRAWYRSPDSPSRIAQVPEPTVFVVRFDRSLNGRRSLMVSETLKSAVLDLYQRHAADASGDVPGVLHGHGFDGVRGYQLAHWLALPDVGHRHATGSIHGGAVVLPAGAPADVVDGVRSALGHLTSLVGRGIEVSTSLWGGETAPRAATPGRWIGPARQWTSVTPVVHERRSKGGPDLAAVAKWCEHAELPEPIAFRESPVPIISGAVMLKGREVFRDLGDRRPCSYLTLRFADPVRGPVALGRARQFGIGLFAPLPEEPRA